MKTRRVKVTKVILFTGALLLIGIAYLARVGRIRELSPADDLYTVPVSSVSASDRLYTVRGSAAYTAFQHDIHFTYKFTLAVSNQCWALEVLPVQGPGVAENQAFDGVNLVAWHYYDTNKIDRSKVTKWTDGYVRIDETGMADNLAFVAPAIWVGYAAQFYLPSGTNGVLRPFWHPDRGVRTTAFVPARWKMLSPQGDLAESIDFFYEAAEWDKALRRSQRNSANRTEKPILLGTFNSVGRTNLGAQIFPLACTYTGFAAEKEHSSGERLPVYKIEVTNVTVSATIEHRLFNTFFRGVAIVEDYRGQRELPLSYTITNSTPPGLLTEPRLTAARQARQLELASKRKELLAKDWTVRTGGHRYGLRVFKPFDGQGGLRYAIMLGKFECSLGDDRARLSEKPGFPVWVPVVVLLIGVAGAVAIRGKRRNSPIPHGGQG